MNELVKFLFDHWPWLTAALVFTILVVICTYKITTKYHHWTTKITTSEIDCKKIDGHIIPKLTNIDSSISALGSSFDSLLVYLKSKDGKLDPRLIKAFSPIQLTELATEILEKTGGKAYIDGNTDYLISLVEKKPIKSPLDVENYSKIVLMDVSNDDKFSHIKNFIYQNPIYKNGDNDISIDLAIITHIMGIYLRNKYFERHPDMEDKE